MIYTAIIGGKDADRTDGVKQFSENKLFYDPRMSARMYKALSHRFVEGSHTVWVDGNIYPKVLERKIIQLLGDQDMAVFKHPTRNSYEEEIKACENFEKDSPDTMRKQVEGYRKRGFDVTPGGHRLLAGGIIIRKNKPSVNAFNEYWWAEVCTKSKRDQLSLPWVIWRTKVNCKVLEMDIRNNEFFEFRNHLIK